MPKFDVEVQLTGVDGNAFSIMGTVAKALRTHLRSEGWGAAEIAEEIKAYQDESMSGDYDHLLQTAFAWVEVV